MSLELVMSALLLTMPSEPPEIVPVLPVTLTVLSWMATPSLPVASIVPELPVTLTVVALMANLSAEMTPPMELFTVTVPAAWIAMPPVAVAFILLELAVTLMVTAPMATPAGPVASIVPALLRSTVKALIPVPGLEIMPVSALTILTLPALMARPSELSPRIWPALWRSRVPTAMPLWPEMMPVLVLVIMAVPASPVMPSTLVPVMVPEMLNFAPVLNLTPVSSPVTFAPALIL